MTAASPFVTLSPLDEARFGVRSARASHVTPGNFDQLLAFVGISKSLSWSHDVRLLIWRLPK